MTKADIIRFLEPFQDDIKIIVYGGRNPLGYMLGPAEARYRMGEKDTKDVSRDGIEEGEGYVLIEED